MLRTLLLYLIIICSIPAFSQGLIDHTSPEDPIRKIQNLAGDKKYQEAKQLAYSLLENNPENLDFRVIIARIYAWEAAYDSAFNMIDSVLTKNPLHADALLLKADIFFWQNDWPVLNEFVSTANESLGENENLMYYSALSSYHLGRREDAEKTLNQLLSDNPDNERAAILKRQILLNTVAPEIFVQYYYDHFRVPYNRNWHMVSVGGIIPFSFGTFSPSINGGHLIEDGVSFINSSAVQLNTDAYILLSEKMYMLTGYGISNGTFFPHHRAVLNLWQVLPRGWAVSAGARYFYWDQHFSFLTLSGEKYLGNYWFKLNNSIFFKEYGTSISSYFTVRRYLENKYNYLSGTIGYGTSPDEPISSISDLQRLKAFSFRLSMSRQIHHRIRTNVSAGYSHEEYLDGIHRNRINASVAFYYKFD